MSQPRVACSMPTQTQPEGNALDIAKHNFQKFALQYHPPVEKCDKCPGVFRSKKDLAAHRFVHTPKLASKRAAPFRCKECGERFKEESLRDWHFLTHGQQPFHCPVFLCDSRFRNEAARSAHIKMEHNGGAHFQCWECGSKFECCCQLHRHCALKHLEPYECQQCGVRNPTRVLFEEHLSDHMGLLPARRAMGLFQLMTLVSPDSLETVLQAPEPK